MTTITAEEVKTVAELAGLTIPAERLPSYAQKIAAVIRYMEELKKLPLQNIPETARLTEEVNVWREDSMGESLSKTEVFQNGTHADGYFVVPAVLKHK